MGVILWQGLIELWDKHCKERDISDIPQQEVLTCTELVLDEADQLIEHNRLAGENQARIMTQLVSACCNLCIRSKCVIRCGTLDSKALLTHTLGFSCRLP